MPLLCPSHDKVYKVPTFAVDPGITVVAAPALAADTLRLDASAGEPESDP